MIPKKVLVIDDDYAFAEFSAVLLNALGYEPIVCFEAEDAQALALDKRPDLILMDISMPGINGVELIRRFKSTPELKTTPIIICTMSRAKGELHEAFSLGALDYLNKPLNKDELGARLSEVFGR